MEDSYYPEVVVEPKETTVPKFNIDRLAREIDELFQEKVDNKIEVFEDTCIKRLVEVDDRLKLSSKEYEQEVNKIFVDIKERLIEEVTKGKSIIVLPDSRQISIQHMDHPVTEGAIKSLQLQRKLMLVGPAGTGKTTMVENIARALELPFYKYSCSRDSSVHDLLGYKQPTSETYLETTFLNAYENGGIFLVDEYDAMSGDMSLFFNGVADNSKFISIPHRDNKPQALKHPDFYLVMCGNTWGKGSTDYTGRDFQDMALMDRFRFCRHYVGYHELLEKEFMKHNYNVIKDLREDLEKVGSYLSTRNVEDISILINSDVEFNSILDMVLQDLSESDSKTIKARNTYSRVSKNEVVEEAVVKKYYTIDTESYKDSNVIYDDHGKKYKIQDLLKAYPPGDINKLRLLKSSNPVLYTRYMYNLKANNCYGIELYDASTNTSWFSDTQRGFNS